MPKPVVRYAGHAVPIWVRGSLRAALYPLNHPDPRLNEVGEVTTSEVLKWHSDGRIETRNTRYLPQEMPDLSGIVRAVNLIHTDPTP